ncbi:site-2 protease family protein [Candidatus Gracilibacteria bacterium]|nr:site-2 protease family protein [Candidatus Gracilibacteria bacterium]MCF7819346.1 site-2 protease family protein [Candidatus Gracilibacteria bacterium]
MHEWGHFFAARRSGVKVEEFALGMGKRLWSTKKGEVEYSLNAVPFGGYVKMLGEEEESSDPRSFARAKLWKRMVITLAGVVMNFLMTIVFLTILFTVGTNPILIDEQDVQRAQAEGVLVLSEPNEEGIREVLDIQKIKKPFPQSLGFAVTESWRISKAVVRKVAEIPVTIIRDQKFPEGVAGPVGIAEITHKIVPAGFFALMKLTALLSLSLAVINLLPIPALDGGRFLFQIIELVTFRRPPEKWENAIHVAGYILLMALLVIITWNDIWRLITQ